MKEQVAAGETRKDAESRRVDVLRGEEEEVDSDTGLDAFFRRDAVEGVLRQEESLLLVGAVELGVFAVLERSRTDGRQRGLEDVELAAEGFLRGRVRSAAGGEEAKNRDARGRASPLSRDRPWLPRQSPSRQSATEACRADFRWRHCGAVRERIARLKGWAGREGAPRLERVD